MHTGDVAECKLPWGSGMRGVSLGPCGSWLGALSQPPFQVRVLTAWQQGRVGRGPRSPGPDADS